MAASSSARVPQAISATTRSCGPGGAGGGAAGSFGLLFLPGAASAAALAGVAATATVVPSTATASSPHTCDQGRVPGDSGEHSRRNSDSKGASPSRRRAAASAVVAGDASPSPAVTCKNTSE